jgi:hypothetical protein
VIVLRTFLIQGMKRVLVGVVVLLVIGGAVWMGTDRPQPVPTFAVEAVLRSVDDADLAYSVAMDEPVFSGGAQPVAVARLNAELAARADRLVLALANQAYADAQARGEDPGAYSIPYRIASQFSPTLIDDNIVSLRFRDELDMGGAEPLVVVDALTYDLAQERVVDFVTLFSDFDTAEVRIAAFVEGELRERHGDSDLYSVDVVDNPTFTIRHDAITFHFSPGLIAPPDKGPQFIDIPYEQLDDLIDENGALGMLMSRERIPR